ncbi:hypothetical protein, partial [Profundibacter sp.]
KAQGAPKSGHSAQIASRPSQTPFWKIESEIKAKGNLECPQTLTRRGFLATTAAASVVRSVPTLATKIGGRRILTLVYDKSLGMMRAVERVVYH